MKRISLFFILFPLAFTACSSQQFSASSSARAPSSLSEDMALEQFISSPDPRAMAKAYVMRLLRIRVRAQAWLQDFDAALSGKEEGVDIFTVPGYQKLLAARPLSERAEAKIVDIYREAHELSSGGSNLPDEKARENQAMFVVAGIRDALREVRKSKAQRVLMHDLLTAMKETFKSEALTEDVEKLSGAFQGSALGQAAKESAPEIKQMIKELPETDDVKEEVEKEAEKVAINYRADKEASSRQPSASAKVPSVGPNGNVMGFEFPAGTYALTFDDGPDKNYTLQILGNLRLSMAKGSFFWITNYAKNRPLIVKTVQNAGMTVANHSYMHAKILVPRDLQRLNTTREKEINTSTQEFTKIYGYKPKYFRLPYAQGMNDPAVRTMIANQGMIHVKWNIDSADWDDKNPETVLARVETQMRQNGRGIILFHDVHPQSVVASSNLMKRHRGKVRWVTIDEIVDELNEQ